ncbi:DUF4091 domain-containing protein [Sphingobacterium sp. SYP-B4668]|uniref:DUF4091 domain-containing protein n=1 Tax=Sphingobacterium sp. SYP-B4668 TaxID=2996035 RepID=UPI0022DE42EA|nr:DUF4091 domain-containing protein [Sphingobacterium sp. SYP-B4668]
MKSQHKPTPVLIGRRKFIKSSSILGYGLVVFGVGNCSCKKTHPDEAAPNRITKYTISALDSSIKVLPSDIVKESRRIELAAAANETESFQIVLRSEADLGQVDVRISELTNGVHTIRDLVWYQVGYVYVSTFDGHPATEDIKGLLPGWYPDPLLENERPTLVKGWSNTLWVNCPIPTGTPPGLYAGKVSLTIGGQLETIDMQLTVFDFTLPRKSTLPTLFSLSLEYLNKVYPTFTPAIREKWFDFLMAQRISPTDMYIDLEGADAKLKIEPNEYHRYLDRMNGFVVYPITATWSDRDASADELIARFEKNRPYIDALVSSGCVSQGNGVFYGFDENDASHFETMKKVHRHIKSIYPQIPIATTSMHITSVEQLQELQIDILVLHITDDIYNSAFADQVRAVGKKVWGYISLQPYHPMPNWRIENPYLDARVLLSAMAYHERFDGFLYWGVNQYNKIDWKYPATIDKNTPAKLEVSITTPTDEYKWLHGDGLLLYPGSSGPLSSIRMEQIRKGLEEYEYYQLLEERFGKEEAANWAGKVAPSMKVFSDDAHLYLTHKLEMAARIMGR